MPSMNPQELKTIVEEVLAAMGAEYESVVVEASDIHPSVMVTSPNQVLVGERGETLQALTHIVKRITEKKYGEEGRHFMLDVNNFQKNKIDTLVSTVKMLAERVRSLKAEVPLQPMSSYERMIIHALFSEDKDIKTESRGEGRERHIVITPRNAGFIPTGDAELV